MNLGLHGFPIGQWPSTLFGSSGDPPVGYERDWMEWQRRVVGAGGTYSPATEAAVRTFIQSIHNANLRDRFLRLNLFCGDQLACCLVPVFVSDVPGDLRGYALDTNSGFVAGNYAEATGLVNDTTKYIDTGVVPASHLVANDTHISVYNPMSVPAGLGGIGNYAGDTTRFYLLVPYSATWTDSAQYDGANGFMSANPGAGAYGHILGTRTAVNSHVLYKNAGVFGTRVTTGGSLPTTGNFYVFRCYGTTTYAYTGTLRAYSFGRGMTAAQAADFYTAMQAFQTALGRQV